MINRKKKWSQVNNFYESLSSQQQCDGKLVHEKKMEIINNEDQLCAISFFLCSRFFFLYETGFVSLLLPSDNEVVKASRRWEKKKLVKPLNRSDGWKVCLGERNCFEKPFSDENCFRVKENVNVLRFTFIRIPLFWFLREMFWI